MDSTVEMADALLTLPTTRLVLITNGAGTQRLLRGQENASAGEMAFGADVASAALHHFAARQGFGDIKLAFLLCQGAMVVINSLRDGGVLTVVAEAEANLGLLLNACKKALAAHETHEGSNA